MSGQKFALDFAEANHSKDHDGRLHVRLNNMSKANICPYAGREIPNAASLGLKPDTIYQLYRHPDELKKAAPTANNIPLLIEHVPVSPEDHNPNKVVGSTGTDAKFDDPYLQNSLVIWEDGAIAGVESGDQRELSMGYRYEADMTPGEVQGVKYDGVMRNIRFNHVALVERGRAGSDVYVGDQQLRTENSPMTTKKAALGKLAAAFKEQAAVFAADGALNKTFLKLAADAEKARDEMEDKEEAEDAPLPMECKDKRARDESEEDRKEREKKEAKDKRAKDKAAKDKARDAKPADQRDDETDEEYADRKDREQEKADDKKAKDQKAMDAAIQAGIDAAMAQDRARVAAVREAERNVRPWIGDLAIACDSAAQVYTLALKSLGVDASGITDAKALKFALDAQPKPGSVARSHDLAMDSAAAKTILEKSPGLGRFLQN